MEAPCPLINTTRLKSIRHRLNMTSMVISESGHVILELKSHMTGQSEGLVEITKELVRISPDGRQIEVYRSQDGVSLIDESYVICQSEQMYTYPNLPDKLWKKYKHAHKFVEIIKSRTAKVTLITERATCKLMENSPDADFQVCFLDGVSLVLSKLKATITYKNGSTLTFHEDLTSVHVSSNNVTLVEYGQQCRNLCLKIEESVSSLLFKDSDQDLFPVIVDSSTQPCVISDHILMKLSTPDQVGGKTSYHSANVWATRSDQTNILLNLPDVYSNAKNSNQIEQGGTEKQSQHNCVYEYGNLPKPNKTAHYKNKLEESDFNSTLPTEAEVYKSLPERYNQCEDFDVIRNRCLNNRKSQSALTTPQKSNISSLSLQPIYSKGMEHLLPICIDNVLDKNGTVCYEDSDQLCVQGMSRHVHDSSLADKFKSECNIPQYADALESSSACSYNKSVSSAGQEQPVTSPLCHTVLCDTFNQYNQAICNTDFPGFTASQLQNNFSTPKNSPVSFEQNHSLCNRYSTKHETLIESEKYKWTPDPKCLQNVRRNLFADQTSLEVTSSKPPPYQTSIFQSGFSELSDEISSENFTSHHLPQDGFFHENHTIGHRNQSLTPDNQNLVPDKSHACKNPYFFPEKTALQTQTLPSNHNGASTQSSLLVNNSLTATALQHQHTPVVPNITKSVLRYSECPCTAMQSQTETMLLNTSSGQNSTYSYVPSEQNCENEHSLEGSEINKATSNKESNASDLPINHQQMQKLIPPVCTSPTKSAPVRKIASLSPQKMSSKIMSENRFQKKVASDFTESSDFFPWHYQATSVLHGQRNSNDSPSPTSSRASYHITQSKECLQSPKSAPSKLKQSAISTQAVHSCKEFPSISQTSGNWSDAHLPFLSNFRNSLEVSSDGYSSPPSSASDVISQVFVPYTGWATFYATGTVWILYHDGTQLGVKSTEAVMIYVDQDGSRRRYTNTDLVPDIVKLKLEKLPKIIDMLMRSQGTNFAGAIL